MVHRRSAPHGAGPWSRRAHPEVFGLEQVQHNGELLSFSLQRLLPGRSLGDLAGELSAPDLERLVIDAGELLARIHAVVPDSDRGTPHDLRYPEEHSVARVACHVDEALGPEAARVVELGADYLRTEMMRPSAPMTSLAQDDFLPKNLMICEREIAAHSSALYR